MMDIREVREDVKRVAVLPTKDSTTQKHQRQYHNQGLDKQNKYVRQIIIGYT
jgi:hypothetical protein